MSILRTTLGFENLPSRQCRLSAFAVVPTSQTGQIQIGDQSVMRESITENSFPLHGWIRESWDQTNHPTGMPPIERVGAITTEASVAGVHQSIGGRWTSIAQRVPDDTIIRLIYQNGTSHRRFYILFRKTAAYQILDFSTARVLGKSRYNSVLVEGTFDILTPATIFSDYGIVTQKNTLSLYSGYSTNNLVGSLYVMHTVGTRELQPRSRMETTLLLSSEGAVSFSREKKRTRGFR